MDWNRYIVFFSAVRQHAPFHRATQASTAMPRRHLRATISVRYPVKKSAADISKRTHDRKEEGQGSGLRGRSRRAGDGLLVAGTARTARFDLQGADPRRAFVPQSAAATRLRPPPRQSRGHGHSAAPRRGGMAMAIDG